MYKIFIDTNIIRHANRSKFASEIKNVFWGNQNIAIRQSIIVNKASPEEWLRNEINCIEKVVQHIQHSKVEAYTSNDVRLEFIFMRATDGKGNPLNFFSNIELKDIKDPDFFGMMKIAFGNNYNPRQVYDKFYQTNIYSRFNQLKKCLGSDKSVDAYLIWAAEVANIPYFLTTDKKLINCARNQNKTVFGTHLLYPSELLSLVGQTELA